VFVAAYAGAIYLPFLGPGRTLTSHEVMVTHPAMRMLSDGAWLVPRYAGGVWLDKPPLMNWITAGFFVIGGGFSEWAARLPSALSAIGLAVLVAHVTRRYFGDLAGLLAGLAQATCVYGYMQGRLGEIDMPFALIIAAAHAVLARCWSGGEYRLPLPAACLLHTLAGLAVLAKGPLAVGFIAATVLGFCAFRRSWQPLRAVVLTPGVVCFLLVAVPWHVGAWLAVRDEAVEQWGYNSIARVLGLHHLGSSNPLLYFWTIPWLVLPWMIVLVLGARQLYREARDPGAVFVRFLWAWFLGGLLLLTLSAFKHKHYCIPILPPLSVLTGKLLAEHAARVGRRARPVYVAVFATALVTYGVVSAVVMPARDHRRATVEFVRNAVRQVPSDAPLYVVGLGQSAVYPYIDHACEYLDSLPAVEAALRELAGRPMWVLTLPPHLATATELGLKFEEVAREAPRKRLSPEEALVLARATNEPPASAP
jgi:4-amino-4-deoxy-L-arabinose transferase-like glycosyltransferase